MAARYSAAAILNARGEGGGGRGDGQPLHYAADRPDEGRLPLRGRCGVVVVLGLG